MTAFEIIGKTGALKSIAPLGFDESSIRTAQMRSRAYLRRLQDNLSPLSFDIDSFGSVFGNLAEDGILASRGWDWGIRLHEPQITRALCHILTHKKLAAGQIRSLLNRLGISPDHLQPVTRFEFTSEQNRIDILIEGYDATEIKCLCIVIEAKIDHHITKGQLSRYYAKVKGEPNPHFFVLAKNKSAIKGLPGPQRKIWRFVSWRRFIHLLLQFEIPAQSHDASAFLGFLFHQLEVSEIGHR